MGCCCSLINLESPCGLNGVLVSALGRQCYRFLGDAKALLGSVERDLFPDRHNVPSIDAIPKVHPPSLLVARPCLTVFDDLPAHFALFTLALVTSLTRQHGMSSQSPSMFSTQCHAERAIQTGLCHWGD